MNFLKRESRKELRNKLDIQMNNNKIMRKNLQEEQKFARNLQIENQVLKEELEKVKKNLRIAVKDNEKLVQIINEMITKYNIKLDNGEEIKDNDKHRVSKKLENTVLKSGGEVMKAPKRTRKKKGVKDSE